MFDLNVEEFDLHPSFISDTVWPALIGDRPWWKKASTWCIIFGVLVAFLSGAIVVLLNVNNQQLLLNVNNQQLELLDKLEKNVQETINSFENKHNVIAYEIEGIVNAAIKDHFLKLAIIVGMATVLILTTVKFWGIFKIALNGKNTPAGKMAEEPVRSFHWKAEVWWQFHSIHLPKCADYVALRLQPINLEGEANNDVIDNDGQQQLLMADVRTHAREGKKLKKCAQCGYQTAHASDMKKHTRIHSGIKPYKCTESGCGYRSAQASDLKKHGRTHSGVKPYECPFCDHQTAQGGNLKTHMQRNHPPGKKSRHLCQLH